MVPPGKSKNLARLREDNKRLERLFERMHDYYIEQLQDNQKLKEQVAELNELNRQIRAEDIQLNSVLHSMDDVFKECKNCSRRMKQVFSLAKRKPQRP